MEKRSLRALRFAHRLTKKRAAFLQGFNQGHRQVRTKTRKRKTRRARSRSHIDHRRIARHHARKFKRVTDHQLDQFRRRLGCRQVQSSVPRDEFREPRHERTSRAWLDLEGGQCRVARNLARERLHRFQAHGGVVVADSTCMRRSSIAPP